MQIISEDDIEQKILELETQSIPDAKEEYVQVLHRFLDAGGFVPSDLQNELNEAHSACIKLHDELVQYRQMLFDIHRYDE